MAVLRIRRTKHMVSMNHPFDVHIDGKKACEIRRGTTVDVTVKAGLRTVQIRSSFIRSTPIEVDVSDAEPSEIEVGVRLNGWRLFVPPMYFWHYCVPGQFLYAREGYAAE